MVSESSNPKLSKCPDCERLISRHAESCPHCGRFIQSFRNSVSVDRTGWSSTIAWGVILSWVIPILVSIVGFALGDDDRRDSFQFSASVIMVRIIN
jgi:hypothetical protein